MREQLSEQEDGPAAWAQFERWMNTPPPDARRKISTSHVTTPAQLGVADYD